MLLTLIMLISCLPMTALAYAPGPDGGSAISAPYGQSSTKSYKGNGLLFRDEAIRFSAYMFVGADSSEHTLDKFAELNKTDSNKYYVKFLGSIDVINRGVGAVDSTYLYYSTGSDLSTVYDYMSELKYGPGSNNPVGKDGSSGGNRVYENMLWTKVYNNMYNNVKNNGYWGVKSYKDNTTNISFENGAVPFRSAKGFPDIFQDTSLSGHDILSEFFCGAKSVDEVLKYNSSEANGKSIVDYFNQSDKRTYLGHAVTILQACADKQYGHDQNGKSIISFDTDSLIYGYYYNADGNKVNGIIQIYVEPMLFIQTEDAGSFAVTFREFYSMLVDYEGIKNNYTEKSLIDYSANFYTSRYKNESEKNVPTVGQTMHALYITYDGKSYLASGGTISDVGTKTLCVKEKDPEDGRTYFIYKYPIIVKGATILTGDYSMDMPTFQGSSYRTFANRLFLTRAEGQPILRMTAKQGEYSRANNGELNVNSNSFKSGGLGVFTSFNAYTDIVVNSQPINLVKSYVTPVKDGNTYKYVEAYPSEVETLDNNDIRVEDEDGYYNILRVKLEDSKNGDRIWLNDIVTTAEHYDDAHSVNWTGENPVVESSGIKSDLLVGDLRNFLTGNTFLSEQGLMDFYTKLVPNYAQTRITAKITYSLADSSSIRSTLSEILDKFMASSSSSSGGSSANPTRTVNYMGDTLTGVVPKKYNIMDNTYGLVESKDVNSTYGSMALTAGFIAETEEDGKRLSGVYQDNTNEDSKKLSSALWDLYKSQYTGNIPLPENTIFLRYVVKPSFRQFNVIRVEDEDGNVLEWRPAESYPIDPQPTYEIVEPPHNSDTFELVGYGTSPNRDEDPFYKDGTIPSGGTIPYHDTEDNIVNPCQPSEHIYVIWKEVKKGPVPTPPSGYIVPQWRLSKYWPTITDNDGNAIKYDFKMTLSTVKRVECSHHTNSIHTYYTTANGTDIWSLNGPNGYRFITPNGEAFTDENIASSPTYMRVNDTDLSWLHTRQVDLKTSEGKGDIDKEGYPTITSYVKSTANLNGVKSTYLFKHYTASWLSSNTIPEGYLIQSNGKSETLTGNKDEPATVEYKIENKPGVKFTNIWYSCGDWAHYTSCSRHGSHFHCWVHADGTKNENILTPSYTGDTGNYLVHFQDYKAKEHPAFVLSENQINEGNTFTTIKYQAKDVLHIYPEVGMLMQEDNGNQYIKWVVGEQERPIQPIVWQTLEYKVYVDETVVGSSVATDSRAVAKANTLGLVNGDSKSIIYKGSSTTNSFQIYRASNNKGNGGILTVKTFALDIGNSTAKAAWGDSSYDSSKYHNALVNSIGDSTTVKKATESMLIDSPAFGANSLDYTGDFKVQNNLAYKPISYNGKTTTTFTHELVIRGGYLVAIKVQSRSGGDSKVYQFRNTSDINAFKNNEESLYSALIEMNLLGYNSTDGNFKLEDTVFKAFEHGGAFGNAANNSNLGNGADSRKCATPEQDYITAMDGVRKAFGYATPAYAAITNSTGWYFEDSTVLVVKEYVTNYDVPSTSFSDKISLSVKGLNTPINKSDFFNTLGKGYTNLRYDIVFNVAKLNVNANKEITNNISAYFEANGYLAAMGNKFTVGGTNTKKEISMDSITSKNVKYLVPNVSITDTTRN